MEPTSPRERPQRAEPDWPFADGLRPVFLTDASSPLERELMLDWIQRNRPDGLDRTEYEEIELPPSRRPRGGARNLLRRLDAALASEDDVLMAPLRVIWLPKRRNGGRSVRLSDLLLLRDPRDPGRLRQRWILRRDPARCRVVAGEPAPASELRERWRHAGGSDMGQTTGLAQFVARQAALALDRAERGLRGARYKVPRLVHEQILGRASVRGGIARLARELGRPEENVARDAERYLREIAATHSPFVIDLVAHLIRLLYTRGYGEALHYDRNQLARVKALGQRHPVVFLPTHKSNLDHLVLQYALHENGHAPNHTAGGINMNFLPVGPLVRRSGVFFIRRSFRDNPVYKFVLQSYVDFLIEKRFSLEWYIEGGRSRSGKLLPPRFGMLAYVVDAYRRGKADDVILIPVSIAYDQIQDVGDYAAEQSGKPKERESFGWFLRVVRRSSRYYGGIHLRFGEPLSLAKAISRPAPGTPTDPDEQDLEVQKLAFEVAFRINRVTPITPISLVTLALLGGGERALSIDEAVEALGNLVRYAGQRELPHIAELDLERPENVQRALEELAANGVVSRFSEGSDVVYRIGPEQQMAASFYRNTVIHFFVNASIAELALLASAEAESDDPVASFWDAAMELRDLLKFEFFFAEKEVFREELRHEIAFQVSDWENRLKQGPAEIRAALSGFRPFSSHRVLRPFLDAYQVVADVLEREPADDATDEAQTLDRCMGLGKQYLLQRHIRSAASVSQVIFRTALRLAENRGLLVDDDPDRPAKRSAFVDEIRTCVRRIDAIEALAASRRAGLID